MYDELIKKYGSPIYLYDEVEILNNIDRLKKLMVIPNVKFNYAVKANSNREILKIIKQNGLGVDSTGIGEVFLNKDAGFTNEEIYCVGNNFNVSELELLIKEDIVISVDSLDQLRLLGTISPGFDKLMVRINPPFGAGENKNVVTGGKNTKFGIDYFLFDKVIDIINEFDMKLIGINQHIGSAYLEHESLLSGVNFLLNFITDNKLFDLKVIDFGGGFGLNYQRMHNDSQMNFSILKDELTKIFSEFIENYPNKNVSLEFEPGRYVVASSGKLIGQVTSIKERDNKYYIGSDLGFSQMIRPTLYDSYHEVEFITDNNEEGICDVVGNICESGDYMCKDRKLNIPKLLDTVIVHDVGAYGYSLSSNYNARLRPIEVLKTKEGEYKVIRQRETYADLLRLYDDL